MWDLRKCSAGPQRTVRTSNFLHLKAAKRLLMWVTWKESQLIVWIKRDKTVKRCLEKADVCKRKKNNYSTFTQALGFLLCNNHSNCRWQPEPKSGGHWSCAAFVPPPLPLVGLSKLFWPPWGLGSVHKHHCLLVCWLPARRISGLWDLLTLLCPDGPFICRLGSTHTLSVPQRRPQWTARAARHWAINWIVYPAYHLSALCPHSE